MDDLQARLATLPEVFDRWLSDDNEHMLRAVHRTVEEGYFSFDDVQHALKALRDTLSAEALRRWADNSGLTDQADARGMNVLCLHAGNIPLVGFHDALAVLLSGARYSGKISRKDPYLLPSFLNEVKKTAVWSGVDVQWTHQLDDFEGMPHDAVLFAGSERSAPAVRQAIGEMNLAKPGANFLMRTAHFSMAFLEQADKKELQQLTEAMLRYGGMGCRSVAVVVAPCGLQDIREQLQPMMRQFLEEHPQHRTPKPRLRQRAAYNAALERAQIVTDDFLLQEGGLELDQDFISYWVPGDAGTAARLADTFGDRLQSMYVCRREAAAPELERDREAELLDHAQRPPLDWRPDGVNTLAWLGEQAARE